MVAKKLAQIYRLGCPPSIVITRSITNMSCTFCRQCRQRFQRGFGGSIPEQISISSWRLSVISTHDGYMTLVYSPTWMVDFLQDQLVGKYTTPMDPMGYKYHLILMKLMFYSWCKYCWEGCQNPTLVHKESYWYNLHEFHCSSVLVGPNTLGFVWSVVFLQSVPWSW